MNKYLGLINTGLLSGIINVLSILVPYQFFNDDFVAIILFGAGIPYGIVTGIYFIRVLPLTRKYLRLFLWIVASGVSYLSGVFVLLTMHPIFSSPSLPDPADFVLGGLSGAVILTISFHFIFHKMGLLRHSVVIVTGMLIPYILVTVLMSLNGENILVYALYISWQTVITTLLGSGVLSREQKSV